MRRCSSKYRLGSTMAQRDGIAAARAWMSSGVTAAVDGIANSEASRRSSRVRGPPGSAIGPQALAAGEAGVGQAGLHGVHKPPTADAAHAVQARQAPTKGLPRIA